MSYKTTDLCDEFASQLQVADGIFRSYGKKTSFHGPIVTVKVFEDNVLVLKALETIPAGSVLVVDGGGSKKVALLGDRLAGIAVDRGIQGIIVYGCIRDSADIAQLDVGVMALGTNPLKSRKEGKGESNVPVSFAGVEWVPGQYVYADEDGIILAEEKLEV